MDCFVRFGFLGCPTQGEGGAFKRWGIYHLDRILDIHHDLICFVLCSVVFLLAASWANFLWGVFLWVCVAGWSGGGGGEEDDYKDDCMVYIQIVL